MRTSTFFFMLFTIWACFMAMPFLVMKMYPTPSESFSYCEKFSERVAPGKDAR